MSGTPPAVEVMIGGHKLLVGSDHPADYTRQVAAHFDAALTRIRGALPTIDAHRAAILAGLAVTDELFQARQADQATVTRIDEVTETLARLLPPGKRGSKAPEGAA